MRYDIAEESTLNSMVETVNEMMAEGWEPQGSLSVLRLSDDDSLRSILYVQAMVLREDASREGK